MPRILFFIVSKLVASIMCSIMRNRGLIIQENVTSIVKRLDAAAKRTGRSSREITLVAVTKNVTVEDIRSALNAGITALGENRVQEAKPKFAQIGPTVAWHFLGHLQTNKARIAAAIFDVIQSVDSLRVAKALNQEAERFDRQVDVLVEVNISGEESKFGLAPQQLEALLPELQEQKSLRLRGLMSLAPMVAEPERTRPFFRELARWFRHFQGRMGSAWDTLSMGMTNDFEVAIEEGATLVRIGTGIFHTPELRRAA
ncbi:MAG: YggS family pyridoxal phosphate-dependent enzyme [candidate division FCPU426 bacterium]